MRLPIVYGCFLLFACNSEPKHVAVTNQKADTMISPVVNTLNPDTNSEQLKDTVSDPPLATPAIKRPTGVYSFLMPFEAEKKILHTIAFYPTTYRLQEEYSNKKDSVIITEGTWAPSGGFIWLYKDQIVQGRYVWKGDTLQYYSPAQKKRFAMEKLSPAIANKPWQTKRKEGALLYGVGTEPFWSVEVNKDDSLVLNMPDLSSSLQVKIGEIATAKDSIIYTADNDSLHVIVYPFFCNDGMSDFVYTKKIKLTYRGQTYHGCGEVFRR